MRKFIENSVDKDPNPDLKTKDPWAGSGSEMTLKVRSGSGSEINSFGSATLMETHHALL